MSKKARFHSDLLHVTGRKEGRKNGGGRGQEEGWRERGRKGGIDQWEGMGKTLSKSIPCIRAFTVHFKKRL